MNKIKTIFSILAIGFFLQTPAANATTYVGALLGAQLTGQSGLSTAFSYGANIGTFFGKGVMFGLGGNIVLSPHSTTAGLSRSYTQFGGEAMVMFGPIIAGARFGSLSIKNSTSQTYFGGKLGYDFMIAHLASFGLEVSHDFVSATPGFSVTNLAGTIKVWF